MGLEIGLHGLSQLYDALLMQIRMKADFEIRFMPDCTGPSINRNGTTTSVHEFDFF
jgi:hypothetical protein